MSPPSQSLTNAQSSLAGASLPEIPDHQLLNRIGRGSYGEVWLARNIMGTFRAVKIVHRAQFKDDRPYEREFDGIKRFEPISRSHLSQVNILHVGRSEPKGWFFYIMELADAVLEPTDASGAASIQRTANASNGRSDRAVDPSSYQPRTLSHDLKQRKRYSAPECLEVALALARALEHLHGQGLIHRDIKPSNIIFIGGLPKLADIGLVTEADSTGTCVGTEGYLPPEGRGSPAGDVYSLGKVIYQMLTGLDLQQFPELPENFDESPDLGTFLALNEVIVRACAPNPADRFPDGSCLSAELELLQHGGSSGSTGRADPRGTKPAALNSVAVLPFVNMSADQENEYLADGITEDLIMALSHVKGMRVPARTSTFAFKGKHEDIRRIGKMLNVGAVVEGSVRKYGRRLRVTAQLVKVSDGFHLWSDRYDREFRDVFEMQDDITRCILKALRGELHLEPDLPLVQPQTSNPAAYQLYLMGRECWSERGVGLEKALRYFELALLEDPDYALALTGVADTQVLRAFYAMAPSADILPVAKRAAERAVAVNANLAEAHSALAMVRFLYDRDIVGAEAGFRRALELNSNYAPAHYWYGCLLAARGQPVEALAQCNRAIEQDPFGPVSQAMLAWHYLLHLQCAEAAATASKAIELRADWSVAKWILGQALALQGELAPAIRQLEDALALSQRNSLILATLSWVCALDGNKNRALELIDELSSPRHARLAPKVFLALARSAMGERSRALELVEAACHDGEVWVPWLRTPLGLKYLGSSPTAQGVLRRLTADLGPTT